MPDRNGLAVVDKPAGWTSHDVVAKMRKILGQKKVGHSGTLDPDATGVLLVGAGRVTRLLRYLTALPKAYVGDVVLGTETTTLDASGEVVAEFDMAGIELADVERVLPQFRGEIMQVPPMVSAIKVGGRRLHELARAGEVVEVAPRPVTIHALEAAAVDGQQNVFRLTVECSSGTYIRSLAADIGRALGGGAHLRNLRRTAIGSFGLAEARALDQIDPDHLLTPAEALRDYAAVDVPDEVAAFVRTGRVLPEAALGLAPDAAGDGPWPVRDRHHELLAVYERHGQQPGSVKPAVVLAG